MPLLFKSGRMNSRPKKVDPALKERAVRLVLEHWGKYPTTTAAVTAVSKQVGVGKESLRRWVVQADVDSGGRPGVTMSESAETKRVEAENRRLREEKPGPLSASHHLQVLRSAGLIDSPRAGRLVLHARTATAEALLAAYTT
jgi:transposase